MPWLERYTKPEVWKAWRMAFAVEVLVGGVPVRKVEKSISCGCVRRDLGGGGWE